MSWRVVALTLFLSLSKYSTSSMSKKNNLAIKTLTVLSEDGLEAH